MSAPQTVRERRGLRRLWLLAFAPAGFGLILAARCSVSFADWYAAHVYRYLAGAIGTVTGAVPFSLTEIFYAALFAAVVLLIVRAVKNVKSGMRSAREECLRAFAALGSAACVMIFMYAAIFGVNYYRSSFTAYSGLEVKDSSVFELRALCAELIKDANSLSGSVSRNGDGVMVFSESDFAVALKARNGYDRLTDKYPVLAVGGRTFGTPKPLLISSLMSYTQISGVSFPFTVEANINVDGPDFLIPATMMHEQSHLSGFMREDEANYLAYAACRESGDDMFRYSGTMLALIHSMNALYSEDYEYFCTLHGFYDDGVRADLSAQSAFLAAHEGKVAEISDSVNDVYLKANSQSEGVKSYGRMVDLLLADYRARHSA